MIKLLHHAIKEFYRRYTPAPPSDVEKREFGYSLTFGSKIEKRHVSFDSDGLKRFLRDEAPFYISYSVGYFKFPDARPMENKILLGSDLVFEFDADEVGLFSDKDLWKCERCGKIFSKPGMHCGAPLKPVLFPDPVRDERLREMVASLVDEFLVEDLGIDKKYIYINFSGDRGYHIHVRDPLLRELDKEARIELAEYVTGQSIQPKYFFRIDERGRLVGPKPDMKGWPGRVAKSVIKVLADQNRDLLRKAGLDNNRIRVLLARANDIIENIKKGIWPTSSLVPLDVWVSIARLTAPLSGFIIDTATSVDVHRLIRLPGSIHGTTGLQACPVKDLDAFDPYKKCAVLSKRPVTVDIIKAPEFCLGGACFGPFKNATVSLPLYVAYFLIGRGVARWSLTSNE